MKSTVVSSSSYVLSLVDLPVLKCYAASTSSPENVVLILDHDSLAVQRKLAHPDSITQIKTCFGLFENRETLLSACLDGVLRIWDPESGVCLQTFSAESRAILSFDVSPDTSLIAAGTELQGADALILFWNLQSKSPIRIHTSTHSDDITSLSFLSPDRLLSASTDGLISISDPTVDDEDEAVIAVANWGCSIAQAGAVVSSASTHSIWAASDMETLAIWQYHDDQLDQTAQIDIKTLSTESDYLITVSPTHPGIFVGSNFGDITLFSLPTSHFTPPQTAQSHIRLLKRLPSTFHSSIVRTILLLPKTLLSGGEDGVVCKRLWDQDSEVVLDMDVDGYSPRKRPASSDDEDEEKMQLDDPQPSSGRKKKPRTSNS